MQTKKSQIRLARYASRFMIALAAAALMLTGGCAGNEPPSDSSGSVSYAFSKDSVSQQQSALESQISQSAQKEESKQSFSAARTSESEETHSSLQAHPVPEKPSSSGWMPADEDEGPSFSAEEIPGFQGMQVISINQDQPDLQWTQDHVHSYETYWDLDELGRCTGAEACIGQDLMPTEERGSISSIKPSGYVQKQYSFVEGKYLYNRCHLIAFCLTGENANKQNLITGTRSMNTAMIPYETSVARYVEQTGNHVLYRSVPVYQGNNLVADGILLQAKSIEDDGAGISFSKYIYNIEEGVEIDYATGESWIAQEDTPTWIVPADDDAAQSRSEDATAGSYVGNANTKKFHKADCSSAASMKEKNRVEFASKAEAEMAGYVGCKNCNP